MLHTKTLTRPDGTIVQLTAEYFPDWRMIGDITVGYFARVQAPGQDGWTLVADGVPADKSLGGRSVEEYVRHGRQGLMAVVRPHEIIAVRRELVDRLAAAA